MPKNNWLNKRGQDLPGWAYVVALILGLFAIIFLIWLSVKSGNASVDLFGRLK